jgi:hypothetical protein
LHPGAELSNAFGPRVIVPFGLSSRRLRDIATPNVEIGTIMRRVRADVVTATHERRVPWDHSSLIGEVILAR